MMQNLGDIDAHAATYTNHTGAVCSSKQLHNHLKTKKMVLQHEDKQYKVSGAAQCDIFEYPKLYQEIYKCMIIADVKNAGHSSNRWHVSHQVSFIHLLAVNVMAHFSLYFKTQE